MGNITDTIKEMQEKNDTETREKLQMVHNMMVDKITAASNKMGDEAAEDKSLPIVSVVDKSEKYQIQVTSVPDNGIENAIGEVISGDFLGGLKNLLSVALNEVLGNTSAGEAEKTDFHVIYANNSFIRLDCMTYKYTFASKGLKDECKNAFCYCMQVGILDLEKVDPQIMLYELTRAIGEKELPHAVEGLEGLTEFAEKLYSAVAKLKVAALRGGNPSDEDRKPVKDSQERRPDSADPPQAADDTHGKERDGGFTERI